jgi:hypothetical protein
VTKYDQVTLALTLIGLALNLLLGLLSEEWRAAHRKTVLAGHTLGFVLFGTGVYLLAVAAIPAGWEVPMGPKISMAIGAILLVGGLVWQITWPSGAQVMPSRSDEKQATGMRIDGNNQGGMAAEIISSGPGPAVDISAAGGAGQSVTGLHVRQTGPGTGLKVIQNGPGIGLRVTVTNKP